MGRRSGTIALGMGWDMLYRILGLLQGETLKKSRRCPSLGDEPITEPKKQQLTLFLLYDKDHDAYIKMLQASLSVHGEIWTRPD